MLIKRSVSFGLLMAGLLIIGAACEKKTEKNENSNSASRTNSVINQNTNSNRAATNSNGNTNSSAATNRNTNSSNRNTQDDDSNDDTQTSNGSLTITNPEKNDDIKSPVTVEGRAPSGPVYIRVKNASGAVLFTVNATSRSGSYKANLNFEFTHTTSGSIEVFTKDADGNEDLAASIPVTFKTSTEDDDSVSNSNTNTSADTSDDDNPAY